MVSGIFAFMAFMEANVYRFRQKIKTGMTVRFYRGEDKTYGKIESIQDNMIFICDAYGHTYKRSVNDIYPAYLIN
jgi:hypothetical protein